MCDIFALARVSALKGRPKNRILALWTEENSFSIGIPLQSRSPHQNGRALQYGWMHTMLEQSNGFCLSDWLGRGEREQNDFLNDNIQVHWVNASVRFAFLAVYSLRRCAADAVNVGVFFLFVYSSCFTIFSLYGYILMASRHSLLPTFMAYRRNRITVFAFQPLLVHTTHNSFAPYSTRSSFFSFFFFCSASIYVHIAGVVILCARIMCSGWMEVALR